MSMPAEHHALVAACRVIGEALAVPVEIPPDLHAASVRRDPLSLIARASGMRTRRVLLRGAWWQGDHGPLLAYREEGKQPVALVPHSHRRYALVDPATGTTTVVTPEIAMSLAAHAISFHRPLPARSLGAKDALRFAVWDSRKDLRTIVALSAAGGLFALATPLATAVIVDALIPSDGRTQLLLIGSALAFAALAIAAGDLLRTIAVVRMEGRTAASLQAAVWDRLLQVPPSFFRDFGTGELVGRAMGIGALRNTIGDTLFTALLAAVFSVFSLGLLFFYDARLALVTLGAVAVGAIVTGVLLTRLIRRQRAVGVSAGRVSNLVVQMIQAVAKFRVAGAEQRAHARWAEQMRAHSQAAYRAALWSNALQTWRATYPIVTMLAIVAALAAGGASNLSTGEFLAFAVAAVQFVSGSLVLSTALPQLAASTPLYERMEPIIQTAPETDQTGVHPGVLRGAIELSHVSFRYCATGPTILHDVSLQIPSGAFVAFVGPSGSGKSTLLRLLLGFERPGAGEIRYDGQDVATLDLRAVRRQIGVVLQHGTLMADDIFHNIIGSSLLTVEDAWKAAQMVGIDAEIRQLPMGMHTLLSEDGSTLSGGQRQRLLIARAIVHKPRILFFDEATSALDNTTQALVTESLARLQATRLVIAHRLSTVLHADQIVVLDQGRIVQRGTYAELMQQDGLFATLARRQIA